MAKLKTGRHTSAIKTQRQAQRRTYRNRLLKKTAREHSKELLAAVGAKDGGKAQDAFKNASSAWDKAAKKGVVHWKTAARRKSRLAARLAATAAA